jgi:hypothetical protein
MPLCQPSTSLSFLRAVVVVVGVQYVRIAVNEGIELMAEVAACGRRASRDVPRAMCDVRLLS